MPAGVSVRTVQLWETDRNLPVRRLPGIRGRILAIPAEIDAWRTAQPALPVQTLNPNLTHAIIAITAAALGAAGMWWFSRPTPLHHHTLENGVVYAYDKKGRVSWTFQSGSYNRSGPGAYRNNTLHADLDGDGQDELLVTLEPPNANHSIVCLNARGTVLWTRSLGRAVRTGRNTYEPPYQSRGIELLRGFPDGVLRILAIAHHHMLHPAQLLLLDTSGNTISEYWHSGHLTAFSLFDVNRDGHPELIAAGINQALKTAEFLVLNPFQMTGASTESDPNFQIQSMPLGVELARAAFTRSQMDHIYSAYNLPISITPKNASFLIDISEAGGTGRPGLSLAYDIDRRLRIAAVSPSDTFNLAQSRLVRERKIPRVLNSAELREQLPLRWLKRWSELPQ